MPRGYIKQNILIEEIIQETTKVRLGRILILVANLNLCDDFNSRFTEEPYSKIIHTTLRSSPDRVGKAHYHCTSMNAERSNDVSI